MGTAFRLWLFVIAALFLPMSADAAEYWYVAEGQTYSFWVDASSLKVTYSVRTITMFQIFSRSPGYGFRALTAPAEFDCAANSVTFLPGVALGDNLAVLSQIDEKPSVQIAPQSVLRPVHDFVCGSNADREKMGGKFGDANTTLKDVITAYLKTFSK